MKLRRLIPILLNNAIWILLFMVFVLFGSLNKAFFSHLNILNVLFSSSLLGLLVVGESFTLITGNFDLSIESTLAMGALLGGWLTVRAGSPDNGAGWMLNHWVAIAILLAFGILVGWLNGFFITRMKMNNFVVTLSMLITLRGLMHLIPAGNTVYNTTMPYNSLKYTPFGRSLYAIGANREAARASGINPEKRIHQVYIIAGFLAALAGWILSARITSIPPNLGEGMTFITMAAAVIGGISLFGGRGNMIGAFGGVLLLSSINAGLNMVDVSPFWISTVRGLIILFAMMIDAQKVRLSKMQMIKNNSS
jgi:ribose/xylose/arabinose/galactoside ABC-type transport system permease subunit